MLKIRGYRHRPVSKQARFHGLGEDEVDLTLKTGSEYCHLPQYCIDRCVHGDVSDQKYIESVFLMISYKWHTYRIYQ
jgi:hypothetical protein